MKSYVVDINCDVGEGIGNESDLMPYISSCSIACGGHAGDADSMRQVVKLAMKHKVKIGAHPSFPDKENFGREKLDMSCAALFHTLESQISSLLRVLRDEHAQLHHVKPHGALYNLAAIDKETAMVIVEVMKRFDWPLRLYVPYKSVIATVALEENIPIVYEAFADRNYNTDLSLVSRQAPNALIMDPVMMFEHVQRMIKDEKVRTVSGEEVPIQAHTFCVHGDTPKAINLTKALTGRLSENNVLIQ